MRRPSPSRGSPAAAQTPNGPTLSHSTTRPTVACAARRCTRTMIRCWRSSQRAHRQATAVGMYSCGDLLTRGAAGAMWSAPCRSTLRGTVRTHSNLQPGLSLLAMSMSLFLTDCLVAVVCVETVIRLDNGSNFTRSLQLLVIYGLILTARLCV